MGEASKRPGEFLEYDLGIARICANVDSTTSAGFYAGGTCSSGH